MATVDLIESLAAIEHERWSDWQRYLHSKCSVNSDGTLTIPEWAVTHWTRQINTPYADLTEQEKESDREQVRRYLHLVSSEPSRRAAVDVDAVMAAVESYGLATHDRAIAVTRGDYTKARDGLDNIEKLFAAIRAIWSR